MVANSFRRDILESLATSIVGQALLLVTGVILARTLGVENRGYFALLAAISLVTSSLGHLGIPYALTHYVARGHCTSDELLRRITPMFVFQCALLAPVPLVTFHAIAENAPDRMAIGIAAAVATIGQLSLAYGTSMLQGAGAIRAVNVLRISYLPLNVALLVLLLITDLASLRAVAYVWAGSALVAGVGTLLKAVSVLSASIRDHEMHSEAPRMSEVIKFGLRALIGTTSPIESLRIDQFLVWIFFSPALLGLYVVALSFVNLPRWISHSFGLVLVPHMAREKANPKTLARITRSAGLSLGMNGVMGVGIIAAMPLLIDVFFGKAFEQSTVPAQVLLFGAVVLATRRVLCEGLRGLGMPHVSTWAEFSSYVVIAVAWIPLSERYGLLGAAWCIAASHVVSLSVASAVILKFSRKTRRL
jgi:O-antigen/teichoic acid export membrane protein